MTNYFYFDKNNQKHGPISEQQLKALATQGTIGPHTPMETDTGHKGTAGQIPGLFVAVPLPPPRQPAPAVPLSAEIFCTNCGNTVSEQAVACRSCGAKPVGHRKFCRRCGDGLNPEQVICIGCGSAINATGKSRSIAGISSTSDGIFSGQKNQWVAALFALFLGGFGAHWLYLGEKRRAFPRLIMCLILIVMYPIVYFVTLVAASAELDMLLLINGFASLAWFILLAIISIWALVDCIMFLVMSNDDFDKKYNREDIRL